MSIEPFIKCSDINASLAFYTLVLDFTVVMAPDPDPNSFMSNYSLLERNANRVHLSAHSGDGVFGSVNYVNVNDIDTLHKQFVERGLNINPSAHNAGVSIKPVEQTWGMKEFSVRDPDGNKLTFGHTIK